MKKRIPMLFIIPALIWGSTFFVIKFQLGTVNPTWSVSYRFILAGVLLMGYSKLKGLNFRFSKGEHLRMLLQGVFLFGFNYWLVYIAEEVLVSALVAISFSMIIFLNILFGALFLKKRPEKKVFLGAVIGIAGTVVLFRNDLIGLQSEELSIFHLIVCFLSVVIASLGNTTSAYNQSKNLPVIQTNAFGMLYGGISIGLIALISGKPMIFEPTLAYTLSLLYLAVFGSIVAFGSYLTLIGKIGTAKAAYVLIILPVIAVGFSALFEGYVISFQVIVGILLIFGGNLIVVRK